MHLENRLFPQYTDNFRKAFKICAIFQYVFFYIAIVWCMPILRTSVAVLARNIFPMQFCWKSSFLTPPVSQFNLWLFFLVPFEMFYDFFSHLHQCCAQWMQQKVHTMSLLMLLSAEAWLSGMLAGWNTHPTPVSNQFYTSMSFQFPQPQGPYQNANRDVRVFWEKIILRKTILKFRRCYPEEMEFSQGHHIPPKIARLMGWMCFWGKWAVDSNLKDPKFCRFIYLTFYFIRTLGKKLAMRAKYKYLLN